MNIYEPANPYIFGTARAKLQHHLSIYTRLDTDRAATPQDIMVLKQHAAEIAALGPKLIAEAEYKRVEMLKTLGVYEINEQHT